MRPHVTLHMMGSLDGRSMPERWRMPQASKLFEAQAERLPADAWIVGRVTMQEFSAKRAGPLPKGRFTKSREDFVAPHPQKTLAVVIDPRGKNRWTQPSVSTEHVVEVLTHRVSARYLAHLREVGVSYLFAGEREVDLAVALQKLRARFGVKKARLDGGAHVNGSFLAAGLVDAFSLVLVPVLDGGEGVQSIVELGDATARHLATHFRLRSVKKLRGGVLWLQYVLRR